MESAQGGALELTAQSPTSAAYTEGILAQRRTPKFVEAKHHLRGRSHGRLDQPRETTTLAIAISATGPLGRLWTTIGPMEHL